MTQPTFPDTPSARPTTRVRLFETELVVLLFLVAVAIVVAWGGPTYRIAADQDLFHLPVVRQFADQWPRPDLRNYASATTPGYHLLMAAVARYVSPHLSVLRIAGGAFGVLFVAVLAWAASVRSAWLALPAAMSVYVLSSTVWLLPENAAWALVTLAIVLALRAEGLALFVGTAATLAALVFVRQTHIWTFATLAAASYSLSRYAGGGRASGAANIERLSRSEDPLPNPSPAYRERGPDARLMAFTLIALMPATLVLLTFVYIWHGLTPPAFQPGSATTLPLATRTGGLAPGAPAMLLAVLGIFGAPLLAWLWPVGTPKKVLRLILLGATTGLLLGVVSNSTYDANNRSGLWNAVRWATSRGLPTLAGRSPLFVGLSTAGGVVSVFAIAALRGRARLVLATALVGFAVVQMANPSLWQRYYEPFVLLWLALVASEVRSTSRLHSCRVAGLVAVVALQVAVVVLTLGRGD